MGQTHQTTTIDAPTDEVWTAIKDFHDLSWAPGVIIKVEVVGDMSGGELGARRVLNDAFHETLLSVDEGSKTFTYSIDDGPPPLGAGVSNYVGKVELTPSSDGAGTHVAWSSSWDDNPTDEAVREFCHPIYVALLADMKKSLEG